MLRLTILIAAILCFSGCGEEETFVPEYEVPAEASIHVRAFFQLADAKGFSFDTTNLIIRYQSDINDLNGNPVCGNAAGFLTGDQQNMVIIDAECLAWRHNDASREILVFHELGHVFLERTHLSELLPNGDYQSIMFGGNWNIFRYYTEDASKRDYYIDELFDASTPTPEWAE